MAKINREDIQIINRHSNWSQKNIAKTLKENIYNNASAWHQFLKLFFLALGISFITFGIIFFFAYNWEELHKFTKIGLIEGLLVLVTLILLFSKISLVTKNILLTASSILVGVLLAVFGQIYQTGANAYDLFLGWTLLITLWVIVSNFSPLWLIYITLINTTLILYAQQVAYNWSGVTVFTLLFTINTLLLLSFIALPALIKKPNPPGWFTNVLALASVSFGTIGIVSGIFENYDPFFVLLLFLVLSLYAVGVWYALRIKNSFYLSIISFSCIVIVSAFLLKISEDAGMVFFIGLFIIASVTLVIKTLIDLQKKWTK
ncbi:DUF2157 domain-containing protein [Flagellimonas pacifica]|uniref:Predicted membrane protein n=1 Tax=Flagellimonas pacifica TaxID=1247520 RepID=A0A285ME34_9FLAO|nr:DUF2157 domain-containing protein [Allomuricauda parva]SNY94973.1 Predicted membrane protein [Allomuricauda parva]